jgi:hypothetical protein
MPTRPAVVSDRSSWIGPLQDLCSKGYNVAEPGKSLHQKGLAYDFNGPDLHKIKAAISKAVAAKRITLVNKPRNLIIEPAAEATFAKC